jgi:tetratricopeptide (TPR) repeat protein
VPVVNNKIAKCLFGIFIFPVMLTIWLFLNTANEETVIENDYIKGAAFLNAGKYKEAIAYFTKYINKNSDNNDDTLVNMIDVYINRAQAYNAIGEYQHALNDSVAGFKLDAYSKNLTIEMSNALLGLNQPNQALLQINKIITYYKEKLHIQPANLLMQRAIIYSKLHEDKRALQDLTKSIELDPTNINYIQARGNFYQEHGNYQKAIEDYSTVLKIDPNNAGGYSNRASSYNYLGQTQLAEKDFKKYQELTRKI